MTEIVVESDAYDMSAYGYATFRDGTVRYVSPALFTALQHAFRLAATEGFPFTMAMYDEAITEMRDEEGLDPAYMAWLDGKLGGKPATELALWHLIGIVPPWATLGELLQDFLRGAKDMADSEGDIEDNVYVTPVVPALQDRPVWLARYGGTSDDWVAFFPDDY